MLLYLRNAENVAEYPDQDAINAVVSDKFVSLSPIWNAHDSFYQFRTEREYIAQKFGKNIMNKPVIIHFAGQGKPWLLNSRNPYQKLYYKYIMSTPWIWDFVLKSVRKLLFKDIIEIKYQFLEEHPSLFSFLKKTKHMIFPYRLNQSPDPDNN